MSLYGVVKPDQRICSDTPEKVLKGNEFFFLCTLEWRNDVNACTLKTCALNKNKEKKKLT